MGRDRTPRGGAAAPPFSSTPGGRGGTGEGRGDPAGVGQAARGASAPPSSPALPGRAGAGHGCWRRSAPRGGGPGTSGPSAGPPGSRPRPPALRASLPLGPAVLPTLPAARTGRSAFWGPGLLPARAPLPGGRSAGGPFPSRSAPSRLSAGVRRFVSRRYSRAVKRRFPAQVCFGRVRAFLLVPPLYFGNTGEFWLLSLLLPGRGL